MAGLRFRLGQQRVGAMPVRGYATVDFLLPRGKKSSGIW
jgi:hypothetical protein